MKYYLAIDIGASSGRHIVGWKEDGELKTEEVFRFPNGVREQEGHLIWDIEALLSHVKAGTVASGSCELMLKRSPMVSMLSTPAYIFNNKATRVMTMMATREPGIFLINDNRALTVDNFFDSMGHAPMRATLTRPITALQASISAMCWM